MTPHMRLQCIPAGMVAVLPLALAPFAYVFGLLRAARRAVHALYMIDQLIVVLRRAKRAVAP